MHEGFLILAGVVAGLVGMPVWRMFRSRSGRLAGELRRFFGADPLTLPIVSRPFPSVDLPNLQLPLDRFEKRRVIGYTSTFGMFENGLREMIASGLLGSVRIGPVRYRQVDADVD